MPTYTCTHLENLLKIGLVHYDIIDLQKTVKKKVKSTHHNPFDMP